MEKFQKYLKSSIHKEEQSEKIVTLTKHEFCSVKLLVVSTATFKYIYIYIINDDSNNRNDNVERPTIEQQYL